VKLLRLNQNPDDQVDDDDWGLRDVHEESRVHLAGLALALWTFVL